MHYYRKCFELTMIKSIYESKKYIAIKAKIAFQSCSDWTPQYDSADNTKNHDSQYIIYAKLYLFDNTEYSKHEKAKTLGIEALLSLKTCI